MNVAFGEIAVHNNRLDKGSGIFGRYLFGHLARKSRRRLHDGRSMRVAFARSMKQAAFAYD
jgi:hypothetical protein